jgi:hypothetical protein
MRRTVRTSTKNNRPKSGANLVDGFSRVNLDRIAITYKRREDEIVIDPDRLLAHMARNEAQAGNNRGETVRDAQRY